MESDTAILHQCFEKLAVQGVDLAPAVYQRFTAIAPESAEHLTIMDERMRGRMLDQVYQLLLDEVDDNYLAFETHMHRGYGANPQLYRSLLTAVKDATKNTLGADWSATDESAWNRSIDRLVGEIEALDKN